MYKCLRCVSKGLCFFVKTILASLSLFLLILSVINGCYHLIKISSHPYMFKFVLTIAFFLIAIVLVILTYKITQKTINKQTHIKFSQIFDFLGEEISMPDSKTLTFTYLNKSLLNNTQYDAEELIGKQIVNTNPNCEYSRMKEFIKPLITAEVDELKYETIRKRKDGSQYPIQTVLKYFNDTNTLIAFSQDLTQDREDIKKQFVSIINHKLRSPLTSVHGSLKIISSGMVGEIPTTMKEMIDMANINVEKLLELINDLLDADKLIEKKPEPVSDND